MDVVLYPERMRIANVSPDHTKIKGIYLNRRNDQIKFDPHAVSYLNKISQMDGVIMSVTRDWCRYIDDKDILDIIKQNSVIFRPDIVEYNSDISEYEGEPEIAKIILVDEQENLLNYKCKNQSIVAKIPLDSAGMGYDDFQKVIEALD